MVMGGGNPRLEVLLALRDEFSRGLRGATGELRGMETRLRDLRLPLLAVTGAIAGLGATSVKAASDLAEQQNRANVVFGQSIGIINDFATQTAETFRLTQREAFEYSSVLGRILQASGFTADASADMSVELLKVAGDLSSISNTPMPDVLAAIRSGLVGEVEPLRRFGVLLSAAEVETKALELGLVGANEELDEAAKVTARTAIVMDALSFAAGDSEKTLGEFAGQLAVARVRQEDLRAEIGEALIPAFTDLLAVVNAGLGAFGGLSDDGQQLVIVLGAVTGGVAALGLAIPPVTTGIRALRVAVVGLGTVATGPIGVAIIAIGAIASAALLAKEGFQQWTSEIDSASVSLEGLSLDVEETTAEIGAMNDTLDSVRTSGIGLTITTEQLAEAERTAAAAAEEARIATLDLGEGSEITMAEVDRLVAEAERERAELRRLVDAMRTATLSSEVLGISQETLDEAIGDLVAGSGGLLDETDAWEMLANILQGEVMKGIQDTVSLTLGLKESTEDTTEAVLEQAEAAHKAADAFERMGKSFPAGNALTDNALLILSGIISGRGVAATSDVVLPLLEAVAGAGFDIGELRAQFNRLGRFGAPGEAQDFLNATLGEIFRALEGNFAGSFAGGGIVPGPIGKPQMAIVHGGEPIGMGNVTVNVYNPSSELDIERAVRKALRETVLRGGM